MRGPRQIVVAQGASRRCAHGGRTLASSRVGAGRPPAKALGDKVKTDKRDCRRLARPHRAGELVAIRIPTPTEEAVRDLCRTRGDMVEDLTRARNRLSKFLLRHSRVWRGGSPWTHKHEAWLAAQTFSEPALAATFSHYRAVVLTRDAQLGAVEDDLAA